MRKIIGLMLIAIFGVAGFAHAATSTVGFDMTATVGSVTGVDIKATPIVDGVWGTGGSATSFPFAMTLDNTTKVWSTNTYYSIDVGGTGGSTTNTSVTVKYAETNNPNGTGHGLGWKSTATFIKQTSSGSTAITTHGITTGKMLLKDLVGAGKTVDTADVGAGWFRLYVGLANPYDPKFDSKSPKYDPTAIPEPSGAEVFSTSDVAGDYTGTLTISATLT
ncbi:MAG: hypothetical protein WCI27_10350 [Candidatus Omnitrophota bacterium]